MNKNCLTYLELFTYQDRPVDTATVTLSEPSPCDDGKKCPSWSVCATGYACKDFLTFQHTGQIVREDRVPKAKHFRRIFGIQK